ncbi:MAG: Holliday junction resolvase RuvX [Isosphaeraceae bacterium]
MKEHEVDRIVVGLPVHVGGGEGTSAALARSYGDWLAKVTGLPVVYYDERYTTSLAEESLIDAGLKRSRRKGLRDMLAARLLLQGYLDAGCPETPTRPEALEDPAGGSED